MNVSDTRKKLFFCPLASSCAHASRLENFYVANSLSLAGWLAGRLATHSSSIFNQCRLGCMCIPPTILVSTVQKREEEANGWAPRCVCVCVYGEEHRRDSLCWLMMLGGKKKYSRMRVERRSRNYDFLALAFLLHVGVAFFSALRPIRRNSKETRTVGIGWLMSRGETRRSLKKENIGEERERRSKYLAS